MRSACSPRALLGAFLLFVDLGTLTYSGIFAGAASLSETQASIACLLLLVGAVFVAETVSVILQRSIFKYRKKRFGLEYAQQHRVFKRAPLHHHFELSGWPETQVVIRFWIIGILCAILALSTLKLR